MPGRPFARAALLQEVGAGTGGEDVRSFGDCWPDGDRGEDDQGELGVELKVHSSLPPSDLSSTIPRPEWSRFRGPPYLGSLPGRILAISCRPCPDVPIVQPYRFVPDLSRGVGSLGEGDQTGSRTRNARV